MSIAPIGFKSSYTNFKPNPILLKKQLKASDDEYRLQIDFSILGSSQGSQRDPSKSSNWSLRTNSQNNLYRSSKDLL